MGILEFDGQPFSWEETKKYADHVREHGITQLLHIYNKAKDGHWNDLKWGDEVEHTVLHFDHKNRKVQLLLRGEKICEKLMEKEENDPENVLALWRKEYARYMIEGVPGKPYGGSMAHFSMVEANMAHRRTEIQKHLNENERVITLTVFPRSGCEAFTTPEYKIRGPDSNPISRSIFFPDGAITCHPRFQSLTKNIRERRGSKVVINVPIFKDENTPSPFVEHFSDPEAAQAAKSDHIYMDSMGFGMGDPSLQVTFQASNITEAKHLYDQLAPVCPLMLALSAGSPIFRGHLTDVDVRWNVIDASCDDRTEEEMGIRPLKNDRFVIRKSRFSTIDSYLSNENSLYNDINLEVDEKIKQRLKDAGMDEPLAQHFAHLFIRDPLTLSSKQINLDDEKESGHFENIQSTVWQSLRFKPPPAGSSIGWRVEFRPCDVQLTDFNNAAFVVFVMLLRRVILAHKLCLVIPMSKVDENMQEAHKNDAARKSKFWFRQNIQTTGSGLISCSSFPLSVGQNSDVKINSASRSLQKMSLNTIINGKADVFIGLIPIIRDYLGHAEIDAKTKCSIDEYLSLISKKASGEYLTTAQWMREFVRLHPEYKKDSAVSDSVTYDLLWRCNQIATAEVEEQRLFRKPQNKNTDLPPETESHKVV